MAERAELIELMTEAERRGDMDTAKKALVRLEQLEDPTIRSAEQPFEGTGQPDTGIGSAALTAGTGAAAQLVSGVGGATDLLANQDPDKTAREMQSFQEAFTAKPTEAGAETLNTLGGQIEKLSSLMRLPIDYLDALATYATTGDKKAFITQLDNNRAGPTRGDRSLVLGPGAATAAEVGPEVALEAAGAASGLAGVKTLSKAADRIRKAANAPNIQVFDDAGRFTDDAIKRLEQLQPQVVDDALDAAQEAGAVLTPEQARRLNLFRERGVTPLAADITRKTDDSIDQQQAIKEGGIVGEIAAGQERQLTKLVEQGITETGGIANDAEEASASIRGTITRVATELDNEVAKAYRQARQVAQGESVDISDYISFVRSNKGKDKITGGVVSSAITDLKNNGLLADDAQPFISVEVAERLRQGLNKDFDSATPRGRSFIREMKDAIDSDVEQTVGTDIFSDARAKNIRFKNAIKRARRDKFDKSKGSLVEDLLDNKVPEEKIFQKIVSPTTRSDDVAKLRDFLLRFDGKQSWDDLRAQVLRNALDKALSTQQIREGGEAAFNARLFANEMKRIKGKKFDLLFNADEKKLISDIQEIGRARVPIAGTAQGEGPTSIAIKRAILARIPLVGPLAEGMVDALTGRARDKRLTQFTKATEEAIQ